MKSVGGFETSAKTLSTEKSASKQEIQVQETIDFSRVKIKPLFEEMVNFDTFAKPDYQAVKVKGCTAVQKSKKLLKFTLDDGSGTDRIILSGMHEYYEPEALIGKTANHYNNLKNDTGKGCKVFHECNRNLIR